MATLTYRRRARKGVDHTSDGVLYVHHFGTGFQELVFADHAAAARFAAANGCELRPAQLTDEQRVPFATNPHVMQHGPKIVIRDNDVQGDE